MKKIGVMQSHYLPWLGMIGQVAATDTYVIGDNFQYSKNGWINRNRIKNINGGFIWLTVPIVRKNVLEQKINEVRIDNSTPWEQKHLRAILNNYRKAPYFEEIYTQVEKILLEKHEYLHDLNFALLKQVLKLLKINTPLVLRSEFDLPSDKNQSLIAICKALGGDYYFSAAAAKAYMDVELFARNGITVDFQDYHHPEYAQFGGEFVSHMSVLDSLLMVGPEMTREFVVPQVYPEPVVDTSLLALPAPSGLHFLDRGISLLGLAS